MSVAGLEVSSDFHLINQHTNGHNDFSYALEQRLKKAHQPIYGWQRNQY